jgi:hypothetical protein
MHGTYESFFEIDKPALAPPDDSCSLKDLFSLKNTKKRDYDEIVNPPKPVLRVRDNPPKIEEFKALPVEDSQLEDNNKWITNKKKRSMFKKRQEEDS